jgi:hypothetical protein
MHDHDHDAPVLGLSLRLSENEDSAACCNSDRRFRAPIAPWPCQQEFAKIRMLL